MLSHNTKKFIDLETNLDKEIIKKNTLCHNVFNYILMLGYLFIMPLINSVIGYTYLYTTICKYYMINGTGVLFANGIFGLLYLLFFIFFAFIKPFDINKSMYINLYKSHFIFKIITFIYAILQLLFMILELVFLANCSDLIIHVSAGLWMSVSTTLLAIVYIVVQLFSCILC
jgi:hypothetical protein